MSTNQVSRRNFSTKAVNKENTEPQHGPKSFIRSDSHKAKAVSAPFQQKRTQAAQTLTNHALAQAVPTKAAAKPPSEVIRRRAAARQVDRIKPQPGQNQVPTGKQRKDVTEASKLPAQPSAVVAPSKSTLGLYKGKIIQSKIRSIWKQSNDEQKQLVNERRENMTKSRSKSVTETHARDIQKSALPPRSKSVVDRNRPVMKPSVTTCPPVAAHSRRPPRVAATKLRKNTSEPRGGKDFTQSLKPKVSVTDKKVNKPPVRSTLSQYRTTESKEERRARLDEWLASKGRTLKRPAMTTTAASTTTAAKPRPAEQEPRVQTKRIEVADKKAESVVHEPTHVIMNIKLDLLMSPDTDAVDDFNDGVDNIVVNLCEALDALETPSRCQDAPETDECQEATETLKEDEMVNDMSDVEQVKEEGSDEGEASDCEEEEADDDAMKSPQMHEEASVVRYSVKTTPYLQSVKKTIAEEASMSGSRRKSNISDLKFLTPVRRSSRIQRNSSRLPSMLADHDPCVSSLAELVNLDDECNAYVYRRNPAILGELPDESSL